jgi:predicted nucleic acid-binding protein
MPFLFDASALVNLIVSRGGESLEPLKGQRILDLTAYETGNSLWKLKTIGTLSSDEASSLMEVAAKVFSHMTVLTPSETDLSAILTIALEEKTSFYDSSYVHLAAKHSLELITDDLRLRKTAAKHVKTRPSSDV